MAKSTMRKFADTIMSNVGKTKGWTGISFKDDEDSIKVVMDGPFMGTWTMARRDGKVIYQWELRLTTGILTEKGKWKQWRKLHGEEHPLVRMREKRIEDTIKEKAEKLIDTLWDLGIREGISRCSKNQPCLDISRWKQEHPLPASPNIVQMSREEASEVYAKQWKLKAIRSEVLLADMEAIQGPIQHIWTKHNWRRNQSHIIFAVIGGATVDDIIEKVKENPNNWKAYLAAVNFWGQITGYKQRQLFARRFFQHWSVYKAAPVFLHKLQGGKEIVSKAVKHESWCTLEDLKWMPQNLKSLLRVAYNKQKNHAGGMKELEDYKLHMGLYKWGIKSFLENFKRRSDSRAAVTLCLKAGIPLSTIGDTVHQIDRMPVDFIMALRNGPKLLQARMDQRWVYLIHPKRQEMLREITGQWTKLQATRDKEAVKKFVESCPDFGIPGVRQLKTLEDFRAEGAEMRHCVGGYAFQKRFWAFSITTEEGRSTLGMYTNGKVYQHYREQNRGVQKTNAKVAEQMTAILKERMKKMLPERK